MDNLVVVKEFSSHVEADLMKGMLESNGIMAITVADDCGGTAGGQTFVRGVKLLVSPEQKQEALELINQMNNQ